MKKKTNGEIEAVWKKEHISLGFLKRENNRVSRKIGSGEIIESFGENDKFEQEKYKNRIKAKCKMKRYFTERWT